jgi:hypothetical protein
MNPSRFVGIQQGRLAGTGERPVRAPAALLDEAQQSSGLARVVEEHLLGIARVRFEQLGYPARSAMILHVVPTHLPL